MLQTAEALSRLGTESAFEVLARAQGLSDAGHDVINLGIGQPDFKTPAHIVEAAVEALRDGHHGYTPANGIAALREAVSADIVKYRKVEVSPDRVVIVPGGKVTMFFAMLMFGAPGKEIIYPNPGFPIYESAINFSGAKPVPMRLHESSGFSFNADEVLGLITPATTLLILNSPANPTGGVTDGDEIAKLVKGLEAHPDVAILSDEIYARMIYGNRDHVSLLGFESIRDRLILLDGWSKTYAMTGWRLGYAVWPEALVDQVTRLCINCHSCVNAPTQHAGIAALTGPQDEAEAMISAFDQRRGEVVALLNDLPGVRCTTPAGAFYAFPNIEQTGLFSATLQDRLLNEAYVATVAGTSFGADGEGYLRISYANSIENIRRAMARIGDFLA